MLLSSGIVGKRMRSFSSYDHLVLSDLPNFHFVFNDWLFPVIVSLTKGSDDQKYALKFKG